MHKTIYLTILALCLVAHLQAQEVLNAAGKTITGLTGPGAVATVEYSIGEVAVKTLSIAGGDVTQGVLQPAHDPPYVVVEVGTKEVFDELYSFKCYPNPVGDELIVETSYPDFTHVQFISQDGRVVQEMPFNSGQINCNQLPAGMYFVRLFSETKPEFKTFKLFKQ